MGAGRFDSIETPVVAFFINNFDLIQFTLRYHNNGLLRVVVDRPGID